MRNVVALGMMGVLSWGAAAEAQSLAPEVEVALAPISTSTAGSQDHDAIAYAGADYVIAYVDRTVVTRAASRLALASADGTVVELPLRLPRVLDLACADDGECAAIGLLYPPADGGLGSLTVSRFSTAGVLHDATPIVLSTFPDFGSSPSGHVAAVDGGFVVGTGATTAPLSVRLLGPSGLSSELVLSPAGGASWDLACSDSICMAVFYDAMGLAARRFTPTPAALDGAAVHLPENALYGGYEVAAAYNGTEFRVATRGGSLGQGLVLPLVGPPASSAVLFAAFRSPIDIGCLSSGDCRISARSGGAFWLADGSTDGGGSSGATMYETSPISCGPDTCGVLGTGMGTVVGSLGQFDGSFGWFELAEWRMGTGADVHEGPVAVAGRLAVFVRQTDTGWDVVARALGVDGIPMGAERIVESVPFPPSELAMVEVGSEYALVAMHFDGHRFTRLASDGTPVDEVRLGGCQSHVSMAWNGTHYLIGCLDGANNAVVRRYDVIGQRVDATPTTVLSGSATEIGVAADGGGWLVAAGRRGSLRVFRVSGDGSIVDTAGTLVRDHQLQDVRVASTDGGHVVAWVEVTPDPETFGETYEVRVANIDATSLVSPVGGRDVLPLLYPTDTIALASVASETFVLVGDQTDTTARSIRLVRLGVEPAEPATVLEVHTDPDSVVEHAGLALGGDPLVTLYGAVVTDPAFAPARVRLRAFRSGPACTDCDAGSGEDGGMSDAGMEASLDASGLDGALIGADGGSVDGGPAGSGASGCGCRIGPTRSVAIPGIAGALLALFLLRRRSRRLGCATYRSA